MKIALVFALFVLTFHANAQKPNHKAIGGNAEWRPEMVFQSRPLTWTDRVIAERVIEVDSAGQVHVRLMYNGQAYFPEKRLAKTDSITLEIEGTVVTPDRSPAHWYFPKISVEGYGPEVEVNEFGRFRLRVKVPARYKAVYLVVRGSMVKPYEQRIEVPRDGLFSEPFRLIVQQK